jgi:hypothetical protein
MNASINCYMLNYNGRLAAVASYRNGTLLNVQLCSPSEKDVAAVMALLPSREHYLNGVDCMLSAVNIETLELRHAS